jgi:hypothetical protein
MINNAFRIPECEGGAAVVASTEEPLGDMPRLVRGTPSSRGVLGEDDSVTLPGWRREAMDEGDKTVLEFERDEGRAQRPGRAGSALRQTAMVGVRPGGIVPQWT